MRKLLRATVLALILFTDPVFAAGHYDTPIDTSAFPVVELNGLAYRRSEKYPDAIYEMSTARRIISTWHITNERKRIRLETGDSALGFLNMTWLDLEHSIDTDMVFVSKKVNAYSYEIYWNPLPKLIRAEKNAGIVWIPDENK